MTKKQILKRLKKDIKKVKKYPDHTLFFAPCSVEEIPHCPKCHRYLGQGFESLGFIYTVEKCVCGYYCSDH